MLLTFSKFDKQSLSGCLVINGLSHCYTCHSGTCSSIVKTVSAEHSSNQSQNKVTEKKLMAW